MGVVCQILLQKAKEGVFRPDQSVVGILKYFVDKPTKFENIDISLVGKGMCEWSESDTDDNTTYYSNKEEYVSLIKNIFKAKNDKTVLSGSYEYPFKFLLPDNIPTSFKNKICTIEYKICVKFVKANFFGTKYKFDTDVTIYGFVNPCSPEPLIFGLEKNLVSLTSNNNINVRALMERTILTPGENIILKLKINNDSNVPISIKTELIRYFTYVSDGKRKKIDRESVKTTTSYSPSLKERSVVNLTCIVPTLPSLYSIQHTKIMIGEYKVRVTAKLPFPHINAAVEVPVVIGERREHLGAGIRYFVDGHSSSSKMPEKDDKNMKGHNAGDDLKKYNDNWKDLRFS